MHVSLCVHVDWMCCMKYFKECVSYFMCLYVYVRVHVCVYVCVYVL